MIPPRESDIEPERTYWLLDRATLLARFIAEEPTLGATALPSLKRFMDESDIFNSDEMWNYHMKGNPDLPFTLFDLLQNFASKTLGDFSDDADRYSS